MTSRAGFLKLLVLPLAATAGSMAAKVDPSGEPMREVDGQLVVTGSGVTIKDCHFTTGPAKSAIQFKNATDGLIVNNVVVAQRESA